MMVGPKLTKFFYGEKKPGLIGSTVLTTVAATLMTLPITLYNFGQISLISIVANILILPTLPYAMGLVFLTGVFAGVLGVDIVISWCATRILEFHIFVVELFGGWTPFLVTIPPYQAWVFVIYLIILVTFLVGWIIKSGKIKA